MRFFLVLFLFLFLFTYSGCTHHNEIVLKELKERDANFIDKHKDELLLKKGPPDKVAKLSTGKEIWTYKTIKVGPSKGLIITVGGGKTASTVKTWIEIENFIIDTDGYVRNMVLKVE